MKFGYVIATSAACLLLTLPAVAEPVSLQPTPLPSAVAAMPAPVVKVPVRETQNATLGPSGVMFAMQRGIISQDDASNVANIEPAAGTPQRAALNTDKPVRTIGGAQMLPAKTIGENIAGPNNLTVLVKVLKTAQLESSLMASGPYTLFAPSNNAFGKLPKASFNALQTSANRDKLAKLLNYHIVTGQHDAASIKADIAANGGSVTYPTLAGEDLKMTLSGGAIVVTDNNGNRSRIALADAYQSNGVIHVVDTVLIPK